MPSLSSLQTAAHSYGNQQYLRILTSIGITNVIFKHRAIVFLSLPTEKIHVMAMNSIYIHDKTELHS